MLYNIYILSIILLIHNFHLHRLKSLDVIGRHEVEMDAEFCMQLPDAGRYADVHAGSTLPPLSMGRIKEYFSLHDKKFEPKYRQLYNERYEKLEYYVFVFM